MNRRRFLTVATVGVAGASVPVTASAEESDSWFDNVGNYDGVVDKTGQDTVRIEVGAEGNGGNTAFSPAAVRVDPGTTVVWEWVNGYHDVSAVDGEFQSEMVGEVDHEFEHTFDDTGEYHYVCTPHESMGMKGSVVVGDAEVADSESSDGATESGTGTIGTFIMGALSGGLLTVLFGMPLSKLLRSDEQDNLKR